MDQRDRKIADILAKVEFNTRREKPFSVVLTGRSTDFTITYSNPIILDDNWTVGLHAFTAPFSYSNITASNNIFKYYNGTVWKTLTLSVGAYNIDDINNQVKLGIETGGDDSHAITISGNDINGTAIIDINNANYKVDFTVDNSLRTVLGFNATVLNAGYNNSPNQAQITTLTHILVNCNIVGGSYLNDIDFPVLYSFPPKYAPYNLMVEQPQKIVYLPVKVLYINSIRIWLTDQDGRQISLNNEPVTLRLHFKYGR